MPFYPERLRLARQVSGLSLEALGEAVTASRQFVHQLETGAKDPTQEMAAALAARLGVTPSFFAAPLVNQVQTDHCHFRKLKTVPQTLLSQASARASGVSLIVEALEGRVGLPRVNFPDLPDAATSPAGIEAAAEKARVYWGLGLDGPIHNMVRVLENAGAVVVRFDDLSERIDALSVTRRRPIVVRSTAKGDGARPRFDLAHELGHLIMHEGIVTGDAETEGQAHRFASAFLIPAHAFLREFPRCVGSRINWIGLLDMKLRWGVSMRALIRRAYDLSILDAVQYRIGNIHLSKTGQTKHEEGDDRVRGEPPELLITALRFLEESDPTALPRLLRDLSLRAPLFIHLTGYEPRELPENVTLM